MTKTPLKDCSILIVDDEPIISRVVNKQLRSQGYSNIDTLLDPLLAYDWIDEFRPKLVLLDIFMPEISGLDLLEKICKNPALNETIILMLSSAGEDEKFQALEMGAMGFIQKPSTEEELDYQIQRTLKVASRVRKL